MSYLKRAFVLLLSLLFLFGGCLNLKQPKNKIEYFTLEYDVPRISGLKPLPVVLRIFRFSVAPVYNTSQIIYREKSFGRDSYAYYRWRANPGDLVTYYLSRDLALSELFKAVLPYDSGFPCSHALEGSVDEFFEWDTDENWKAVLSVSVTLMAENEPVVSKRIVFQKAYRAEKTCDRKSPKALAEAMSRAMAEVSDEILKDIYHHLNKR
jgi:ABC-type uncharacterized transport system auxiliary subunit